jgi:hypothetical protein
MAWWVNGEPVYDTLLHGNGESGISPESHVFAVRLRPGANVVVVRVSGGRAGFRLRAGLPTPERSGALLRERENKARSDQIRALLATVDKRLGGGNVRGAREALTQVLALGEVPPAAELSLRLRRMELLEREEKLDEACAEAARLLESDLPPWTAPVLLARLGDIRLAQGKRDEARTAYAAIPALPSAHPRTVERAKARLAELGR